MDISLAFLNEHMKLKHSQVVTPLTFARFVSVIETFFFFWIAIKNDDEDMS